MVVVFVPLGITPDKHFLAKLAPGMIWVFALLATLLSLESLFKADFEDGSLEQMLVSPLSLFWIVGVKVFCHWLLTGVPSPISSSLGRNVISAVRSLFRFNCLAVNWHGLFKPNWRHRAVLTVSLRRGGLVLSLIVMPLYVPILIFGADAVNNLAQGFTLRILLLVLSVFFPGTLGLLLPVPVLYVSVLRLKCLTLAIYKERYRGQVVICVNAEHQGLSIMKIGLAKR